MLRNKTNERCKIQKQKQINEGDTILTEINSAEMVGIPASYSGHPRFKPSPQDRIF
jgi:hypothetical protein